MTITVFCFADYTLSGKKYILFIGYVACALGFLTKGLIGVLIPGMVILPWVLFTKQWKKIPSLLHPIGLLIFLTIAMPWIYLAHLKYPAFLQYFFIDQQFSRFSSDQFNNQQPWPFYLLCLMFSFLPWLFVSQFKFSKQALTQQLSQPIFILVVWWFISVTVFFSIPPSKLVGYILPATAPLAILIATMVDGVLENQCANKFQIWSPTFFVLIIGIAFATLPVWAQDKSFLNNVNMEQLYWLGGSVIISIILFMLAYQKQLISHFKLVLAAVVVLCMSISFGVKILDQKNNATQVSFQKYITPDATIVFYNYYFYDVPFLMNLQKPVYLVDDWEHVGLDSSAFQIKDGLLFEPERKQYRWSEKNLAQKVQSGQPVVILARTNSYKNSNPHAQVLHYRNYDVYFLNYPQQVQK